MKRTLKVLLILLIIIGLGLALASNRLSSKIESMLRDDAVAAIGLAVELESVDIELARGTAAIRGMKVANPPGFPSEHVFDLSSVHVDISTLSLIPAALGWSPYRVENIHIEAPMVTVDVDEDGRTNLDQVSRTVQKSRQEAATGKADKGETPPATNPNAAPDQAPGSRPRNELARFTVDRLTIDELGFKLNRAGKQPESGSLRGIEMEDLGGEDGMTAAALGVKVSARLASEILAVVMIRKAGNRLDKRAAGLLNQLFKGSGQKPGNSEKE